MSDDLIRCQLCGDVMLIVNGGMLCPKAHGPNPNAKRSYVKAHPELVLVKNKRPTAEVFEAFAKSHETEQVQ